MTGKEYAHYTDQKAMIKKKERRRREEQKHHGISSVADTRPTVRFHGQF